MKTYSLFKGGKMWGCGYDEYMIHWLFIHKKISKTHFKISNSNESFTYEQFSKKNAL
jgi:hypothetical protein